MFKSKWDPFALHVLLPNNSNDLGSRNHRLHKTSPALSLRIYARNGGACLQSQHLGRGDRKLLSSNSTEATQQEHVLKEKRPFPWEWPLFQGPHCSSGRGEFHFPTPKHTQGPCLRADWKDSPYLRDVDLGALRPRHHHGLEVVVLRQGFLGRGAGFVPSIIEDAIHLILKCLT